MAKTQDEIKELLSTDLFKKGMANNYIAINLVMTSDKTFASPSTAADFCIGSSNNGWLVWKDNDGNTLDSVYRKQLE